MKEKLLLITIIFLAAVLRFYALGSNPPGLDWDEASQGYNAYSILRTGHDEYGNFLPLAIRSFDDYKPPVYTYLTIPSIAIFGLTPFAVRFPAAIIGTLSVLLVYMLVALIEEIFADKKKKWHPVALFASFFLAISPWHLQFSRAAFEGNVGVFFFAFGIWFFLKGLKEKWWYLGSSFSFLLAMYSYHSFRALIPCLFIVLGIFYWKKIKENKLFITFSFLIFFIGIFPILLGFFNGTTASARLSMVTIFTDQSTINTSISQLEQAHATHDIVGIFFANRRFVWASTIIQGYLEHFSPDFLFIRGDSGQQHQAVGMGMLYLWDLPFLLIGIFVLLTSTKKEAWIILILILLAPIPSSITTGTPHAVRDIGSLPYMQIIVAFGVWATILFFSEHLKKWVCGSLIILIFFSLILNMIYYLHQYYTITPFVNAKYWEYGYQQMFTEVKTFDKKYQHILITYYYDEPYIYYLFYNKIDPSWYQYYWKTSEKHSAQRMYRKIGKYEFLPIDWTTMQKRKHTLIIAAPQEVPKNVETLRKIYYPDGSVAFDLIGL